MKRFRWFGAASLSTAIMMGFVLNACTNEEDGVEANDEFAEVQSALSSATVTKGALTVRTGPGTWYERIGGVHYGRSVEVLQEQAGWIKIKYKDTEGWIYRPDTDFVSGYTAVSCAPEIADFIRDNYPDGYNIIFTYNGGNEAEEFHRQAEKFSKTYHPLNVADGALQKDVFKKAKTYEAFKQGIFDTGLAVVHCLEEHPREGYDDSRCSQIKNLTIMAHGDTDNVDFGDSTFYSNRIPDFTSNTYGYLNLHQLGIQLYACHTARKPGVDQNWYERYFNGKSGGVVKQEDTFVNGQGSFAQLLSEAMGPDATVFGHTTRGHTTHNYAARCYGKLANGAVHGKHMFDVYYPQSYVEEQAKRLGWDEDKTRTSMYEYYSYSKKEPKIDHFAGDDAGRSSFIDPEGKGKSMRDGWLSEHP